MKPDPTELLRVLEDKWQLGNLGMEFGLVKFDTYGSQESVKAMKDAGYLADVYSVDTDFTPWEEMKQALYDERSCAMNSLTWKWSWRNWSARPRRSSTRRAAPRFQIIDDILGEYRFGVAHSRHQREYEHWLEEMVSVCNVLEVSEETAIWYAELRGQLKEAGTPIPSNDVWIAALCRQHTLSILSRDRHFDLVKGLRRLDW